MLLHFQVVLISIRDKLASVKMKEQNPRLWNVLIETKSKPFVFILHVLLVVCFQCVCKQYDMVSGMRSSVVLFGHVVDPEISEECMEVDIHILRVFRWYDAAADMVMRGCAVVDDRKIAAEDVKVTGATSCHLRPRV